MPPDDYSAVVSGGLKIKGVNPSSKVSKHKKKKPKPETDSAATEISQERAGEESTTGKGDADSTSTALTKKIGNGDDEEEALRGKEEALTLLSREGKTEAELRHEERRRKRVRLIHSLLSVPSSSRPLPRITFWLTTLSAIYSSTKD